MTLGTMKIKNRNAASTLSPVPARFELFLNVFVRKPPSAPRRNAGSVA